MVLRNGGHFPRHGFSPGSFGPNLSRTHMFHMFFLPGTLNNHILMDVLVKQPIRNGCLEYQVYVNSHVFNIYREETICLSAFV